MDRPLAGRSILLVEDEPLIALDIQVAFEKAGARVFAVRVMSDAMRFVDEAGLSAAVLDFGRENAEADAICGRLKERAIPFVLHSGYGHVGDVSEGGAVVPKPADPNDLVKTVVGLLR
jgi:DNA-binding response OmpR family regulator